MRDTALEIVPFQYALPAMPTMSGFRACEGRGLRVAGAREEERGEEREAAQRGRIRLLSAAMVDGNLL